MKSTIISNIRKASSLKTIVLGLFVTCLLLSNCAVRKSIEAFLQGSVHTESGMGNGFKKIKATPNSLEVSNQVCSTNDQIMRQSLDFQGPKTLDSLLLPHALFLTVLFGFIAAAFLALLHNSTSTSFPKASLAFNGAPLYIKNRLLLI